MKPFGSQAYTQSTELWQPQQEQVFLKNNILLFTVVQILWHKFLGGTTITCFVFLIVVIVVGFAFSVLSSKEALAYKRNNQLKS